MREFFSEEIGYADFTEFPRLCQMKKKLPLKILVLPLWILNLDGIESSPEPLDDCKFSDIV